MPACNSDLSPLMQPVSPRPGKRRSHAPATPPTGPPTRPTLASAPIHAPTHLPHARSSLACMPCCPMPPGWAVWRVPVCPPCSCVLNPPTRKPSRPKCAPPWPPCKAHKRCCSSTTTGKPPSTPEPTAYTWGRKTWRHSQPPNCRPSAARACAWASAPMAMQRCCAPMH